MDKSVIIKLVGISLVLFIVMIVISYFLFPYLSKDSYDTIVYNFENGGADSTLVDSLALSEMDTSSVVLDSTQILTSIPEIELTHLKLNNEILLKNLDSLNTIVQNQKAEIEKRDKEIVKYKDVLYPEAINDRLKSLLNLEEGDLSPILQKLSNQQIVKIYISGGNTQREKILRALKPEKAAEIIEEVML